MITDGYIRLRPRDVLRLELQHLGSWLDEMPRIDQPADWPIRGTSEWTAVAARTLSFGWDWSFDPMLGRIAAHWKTLRTNLMMIHADGRDASAELSQRCVARLLYSAGWERVVATTLALATYRV